MIRDLIKKYLLIIIYFFYKRKNNVDLKVLAYHRITEEQDLHDPLKISTTSFDKQINFLKNNYTILSGDDLLKIINENKPLPDNSCIITFDDGWLDNYSCAYPILKKHDVPAILFVSTDYMGCNEIFWHEQLQIYLREISCNISQDVLKTLLVDWPEDITGSIMKIVRSPVTARYNMINHLIANLKVFKPKDIDCLNKILSQFIHVDEQKPPLMLSWQQLIEISENNFHIGSHTKTHAILTQVSDSEIIYELTESKKILEEKLDEEICFFSYPNGNYSKPMMNLVKNAGYVAAFAMVDGVTFSREHLFEIKRYMIREDTFAGLRGEFSELLFKIELAGIRRNMRRIFSKNSTDCTI